MAESLYNRESRYDADPAYRPFVLWFETLRRGATAQVYLRPHPDGCDVVAHWNGQVRRTETCADLAEAERLVWEWWIELPNLMGSIDSSDLSEVSMPWA